LGREEMDLKLFWIRGVLVADASNFCGFGEGDAEFFANLSGEGLFEGFASAYFAAGKIPLERGSVPTAALADENAAIGTFNDSCDDLEHWK
jgi:hypothetical protein